MNERDVTPNSVWRHFKGQHYAVVITVAEHTETGEDMVIYACMCTENISQSKVYARPLAMFLSEVDREKYPEAEQKYRFEKLM